MSETGLPAAKPAGTELQESMSADAPTSRQLRRLGAVVVVLIFGLGLAVTRIPEMLQAESAKWVVTIPLRDGVDGLQVGGEVLIGGIPRGEITGVEEIKGETSGPVLSRELIRVEFKLDRNIVLARNAVIRRGSTSAGNIGYLDIKYPGSRNHRFKPGEEPVISIARSTPRGGPLESLIGRTNGEMLERILSSSEVFIQDAEDRRGIVNSELRSIQIQIKQLDLQQSRDIFRITNEVQRIIARYREILERMPLLERASTRLRADADSEADDIRAELDAWRRRLLLIDIDLDTGQEDVDRMRRFSERLEPRLQAVALDLQSALEDASSIAIRTRSLRPEVSDGLSRTMARMILAGGQLKLAMNDLAPMAIKAITTRPDRASESRRLLLESTNDVVLAGMQLRDAARFLEQASRRGRADVHRESDPPPNLDQSLRTLEETMDRLAERLRREIEADLR